MPLPPFHIAFPVHDIDAARSFYRDVLGCREGRSTDTWIDFDLFGHQVVAHYQESAHPRSSRSAEPVDGHTVPIPHFGVVLNMEEWSTLRDRVIAAGVEFVVEPHIRFRGKPGEQATMFFLDPSGNALEFKAFQDMKQLFATD